MNSEDLGAQVSDLLCRLGNLLPEKKDDVISLLTSALSLIKADSRSDPLQKLSSLTVDSDSSAVLHVPVGRPQKLDPQENSESADAIRSPVCELDGPSNVIECCTPQYASVAAFGDKCVKTEENTAKPKNTSLSCPVCCLKFFQWPPMEHHLYIGHATTVAPVCWRCQGVFANHAVLLAHECFDWGRLNLPCESTLKGSSAMAVRQRTLLLSSTDFGYPTQGIFLRRRCGLCYRSTCVYDSYVNFERHKRAVHSAIRTDRGLLPPHPNTLRRSRKRKYKPELDGSSAAVNHPRSEEALRLSVRRLFDRFQNLRNGLSRAHRLGIRRNNRTGCLSSHSWSTVTAMLADRRGGSSRRRAIAVPGSGDVSQVGSVRLGEDDTAKDHNQKLRTGVPVSSCDVDADDQSEMGPGKSSKDRILGQKRRRRMIQTGQKRIKRDRSPAIDSPKESGSGRFVCGCCSTEFRLASRLRHGHIPASLGGLSPKRDDTTGWTCRTDPSNSSNNDSHDTNSDGFGDSTHPSEDGNGTRKRKRRTSRRLKPLPSLGQLMGSESAGSSPRTVQPDGSTRLSNPDNLDQQTNVSKLQKRRLSATDSQLTDMPVDSSVPVGVGCTRPSGSSLITGSTNVGTCPPFVCEHCNRSYARPYSLQRHLIQMHIGEYRFCCGYCEFRTNDRSGYDEHLARHFQVKQYTCEFCDARFTVKRELNDHVAFKHTVERKFDCRVCGLAFKTAGTLSRHRKIHGQQKLFECSICGIKFTRGSNLKRHMGRLHSPRSSNSRRGKKNKATNSDLVPRTGESTVTGRSRTGAGSCDLLTSSDRTVSGAPAAGPLANTATVSGQCMMSRTTVVSALDTSNSISFVDSVIPLTVGSSVSSVGVSNPTGDLFEHDVNCSIASSKPTVLNFGEDNSTIMSSCSGRESGEHLLGSDGRIGLADQPQVTTVIMVNLTEIGSGNTLFESSTGTGPTSTPGLMTESANNGTVVDSFDGGIPCSLSETAFPNDAFSSLFPLQISSSISPSVLISSDSVDHTSWPTTADNVEQSLCYLLTATEPAFDNLESSRNSDQSDVHAHDLGESGLNNQVTNIHSGVVMSDSKENDLVSSVTGDDHPLLAPSFASQLDLNDGDMITRSDRMPPKSTDSTVIWRPVESLDSENSSIRNSASGNSALSERNQMLCVGSSCIDRYLVEGECEINAEDEDDDEGQNAVGALNSNVLLQNECHEPTDVRRCSPRFPSPVSESRCSPHPTLYHSSSPLQSSLINYCSHADQEQLTEPLSFPSSEDQLIADNHSAPSVQIVFPTDRYVNTYSTQTICSLWSSVTQSASASPTSSTSFTRSSPNRLDPDAIGADQCSGNNFSVGYLIGQNQQLQHQNAPISDSKSGTVEYTLSDSVGHSDYFPFEPPSS
ncbi:unnamed protein product [Calicophoron daubneyi]|uniref:C2H2-type domain-containing protein n=1 Tax=Calicophoron daubneyi TaxID=300641 RepID=A0AAV2TLU8_CALDB